MRLLQLRSSQPGEGLDSMTQADALEESRTRPAPASMEPSLQESNTSFIHESVPLVQVCFSQKKLEDLARRRDTEETTLNPGLGHPLGLTDGKAVETDVSGCQCDFQKEEGDMVAQSENRFAFHTNSYARSNARTVIRGNISTVTDISGQKTRGFLKCTSATGAS